MCGPPCMPPHGGNPVINLEGVFEVIGFAAGPIGVFIALVASIILLDGPRRYLSIAMMALMAGVALLIFSESLGVRISTHQVEFLVGSSVLTFSVLGLISLIHWPTQRKTINLPILIGVTCSALALTIRLALE